MRDSSRTDPALLALTLSESAAVVTAGAAVEACAVDIGLPATRANRLRVLLETLLEEGRAREAVAGETDSTVEVHHGAGHLHVVVTDRRLPLSAAEARHARSRRLVALGFAEAIHLGRHGADGNRAELEVHVDDDTSVSGEERLDGVDRASDEAAAALELRPMEPADAEGLARCMYRCYGYSYLDPTLYRPRQIVRALRSQQMHSVVAMTPEGELVGHLALTFEKVGDRIPEAGKLVVDPRYRGHHVAERLAEVRLQVARDLGLPGYWSECVTNHPFSQKEVIGTGGSETGLLLGAVPASLDMEQLANHLGSRHTLLPFYVPLHDEAAGRAIHVPSQHAGFAGGLVAASGVQRRVVVPDAGQAHDGAVGTTSMEVSVAPSSGVAHMRVAEVGTDIVERVGTELEGLLAFDLAVTHLDLPAVDPATAWAVEALERLGFFWGAWVPCFLSDSDVLRLQRLADRAVDVDDSVVCARAQGEAVRDHVVAEWRRVTLGA